MTYEQSSVPLHPGYRFRVHLAACEDIGCISSDAVVHPRTFLAEFTAPAVEAWRVNQSGKHLAVHAIAQLDILAEVAANWTLSAGRIRSLALA